MSELEHKIFLASFHNEGFECIVDLTAIDEENVVAKLNDEPERNINSIINMITMRARFNSHRNTEVWIIKIDSEFTEESFKAWQEEDPQAVANFFRDCGDNIYGGDHRKAEHVIT